MTKRMLRARKSYKTKKSEFRSAVVVSVVLHLYIYGFIHIRHFIIIKCKCIFQDYNYIESSFRSFRSLCVYI